MISTAPAVTHPPMVLEILSQSRSGSITMASSVPIAPVLAINDAPRWPSTRPSFPTLCGTRASLLSLTFHLRTAPDSICPPPKDDGAPTSHTCWLLRHLFRRQSESKSQASSFPEI